MLNHSAIVDFLDYNHRYKTIALTMGLLLQTGCRFFPTGNKPSPALHEMSSELYFLSLITTGPGHLCKFIEHIY
jgi:hypothetical protein